MGMSAGDALAEVVICAHLVADTVHDARLARAVDRARAMDIPYAVIVDCMRTGRRPVVATPAMVA